MNPSKVREVFKLFKEAMCEDTPPSTEDWAAYGRTTAAAIKDRYDIAGVSLATEVNSNWKSVAYALWLAAKKVGL